MVHVRPHGFQADAELLRAFCQHVDPHEQIENLRFSGGNVARLDRRLPAAVERKYLTAGFIVERALA